MHIGHARTFWTAYRRAVQRGGTLALRYEDLDPYRSRSEYLAAMIEDLCWLGVEWQEGPDVGGPYAPYSQSERYAFYVDAWRKLRQLGAIYPCVCSRKDLLHTAQAPHESDDEQFYPGTCRARSSNAEVPAGVNWRFRVSDDETIRFHDLCQGAQEFVAGRDFGDFVVWRRDDVPAYQLAVVVDDDAMRISEVVRGLDLLRSTARQILIARALGLVSPDYYHCPLVADAHGVRLAKRHDALSLRALRNAGVSPESLRALW